MDQARRGAAALASSDFPAAVSHYTEAISQSPQAVDYYIKRSTAYTRASPPDHESAFNDAETAVVLAIKRAKREFIAQAQLRRAIALFGLGRWADSKQCLQWVRKLNKAEKSLAIWEMKVDGKLKSLEDGEERAKVTIKEVPEIEVPKAEEAKPSERKAGPQPTNGHSNGHLPASTAAVVPQSVQTPPNKIRHEWYQQNDAVIVSLFAKGIPKDKVAVDIQPTSLEVSFPLVTGSTFDFSLDPLFAKIDPSTSFYKIMSTKTEFTLRKATPGHKWANLEGTGPVEDSTIGQGVNEDIGRAVLADSTTNNGPAYPTSSKSGPKNWDKLASDLTKKPTKEGDGDDGGEPDAYIDDEESDPVNGFFKTLYKGADDDTRRAMMKSYQESNGTALSTNWAEVAKGKVETTPPDGMEAKPW
ncbi:MAG: hypothetical protein Q9163_003034 [Psora crenata]